MKKGLSLIIAFCCTLFLFSCSVNRAKVDDSLKKYFDEYKVEGCFTFFDNAEGKVTVYNMELDTQRFLPASTFKIANALIGLQTGRITDEKMVINWDGKTRFYPNGDTATAWNKNLDMTEAFKVSAVPYFQEVARRIGKDTMQHWIDTLGYGNKIIGDAIDTFWLNNTLKISPDEQLGLVKKLYFDQLPFRKMVQQQVRDAMLQEDNANYKLSYKTGWAHDEKGHGIGWLTGWIEENKHVYFFVTLVKAPDAKTDLSKMRWNITQDILKDMGFFEGKK